MSNVIPLHSQELNRLEGIIERGLQTFVAVGEALATIRDEKLYRPQYRSFKAYIEQRWGWTDGRARQLILGASTASYLESVTGVTLPSEATARAVKKVPVEHQATVVNIANAAARADDKPLSTSYINAAWEAVQEPMTTGHVDLGDGEGVPVIVEATRANRAERGQRQQQHMDDGSQWHKVVSFEPAIAKSFITNKHVTLLIPEIANVLTINQKIRVSIWVEKETVE